MKQFLVIGAGIVVLFIALLGVITPSNPTSVRPAAMPRSEELRADCQREFPDRVDECFRGAVAKDLLRLEQEKRDRIGG